MKLSVKLETSQDHSHIFLTLDELDISKEEWDALTEEEKKELIQKEIDDLPEQPYWVLGSFSEQV